MISKTFKKIFGEKTEGFAGAAVGHTGSAVAHAGKGFFSAIKAAAYVVKGMYASTFGSDNNDNSVVSAFTEVGEFVVNAAKAVYHGVLAIADVFIVAADVVAAAVETTVAVAAFDSEESSEAELTGVSDWNKEYTGYVDAA